MLSLPEDQSAGFAPEGLVACLELAGDEARQAGIDSRASILSFADHMSPLGLGREMNPCSADIIEPLRDRLGATGG